MKKRIWALFVVIAMLYGLFLFKPSHIEPEPKAVEHGGPAIPYGPVPLLELTQDQVSGGGQLDMKLKIQPNQKVKLKANPQLRIFKAGQPYGEKALKTYDLESWDISPLDKGVAVEKKLSVSAPVEPGYYRIEFAYDSAQTGGASADLFVQYPVGTLRLGTIQVNKTVEGFGRSLRVDSITMSDKITTVQYSLTPGVRGFMAELITDDGKTLLQRGGIPFDEKTITQAQSTYEPISTSVKRLRFRLSHIQLFLPSEGIVNRAGEWEMEIPLD